MLETTDDILRSAILPNRTTRFNAFNIDQDRRQNAILPQTLLMGILMGRTRITNFPSEFEVVSVHWDHWANGFCLGLISPDFEQVAEGNRAPSFILTLEDLN